MKVTIAVEGATGPNPEFNSKKPASAENPRVKAIPKGTVIDHPEAWRLCLSYHPGTEDYLAEPADEEATAIVTKKRAAETAAKEAADAAEVDAVVAEGKKVKPRPPRQADAS